MKRLLYILLFIGIAWQVNAQALLPKPNPPRLVVDKAGVLSAEQVQILEQQLVALDDSTSNQISIVTLPTLEGGSIDDYAVNLFRSWGIGNKKTNNGVLILVAVNDHAMRIEVGYGLEGAIPDVTAKSIINNDLGPNFKEGNYYRGFQNAITSLSKAAAGEYKEPRAKKNDRGTSGGQILIFFIIIVIVLALIGKGGSSGGGGMMSRRGAGDFILPFILGNMLGGGGRSSGGGGWSGGGSSGGGFGGFGGGSSGGGGASGSW
jgi:uncharacterized protein